MRLKFFLPLLAFLMLVLLFYFGLKVDSHHLPSALLNRPLPPFEISDLSASKKQVTQQIFLGRISLLNIWASWCSACRAEHEVLEKISRVFPDQIQIYGLNYKDQRQDALRWLERRGNPYSRVLFDPKGTLGMELGVYGTPETFLIDRQGIVRYKHVGPITIQVWENKLYPKIVELL